MKPVQAFWIDRRKKDGRHYCCVRCGEGKLRGWADRDRMFDEVFLKLQRERLEAGHRLGWFRPFPADALLFLILVFLRFHFWHDGFRDEDRSLGRDSR